jgi:hypothetical protein
MGALLGDDVVEAGPGDLVFKPRNQWHTFWNAGDEPCRILEIISPAGFERYFQELVDMGGSAQAGRSALVGAPSTSSSPQGTLRAVRLGSGPRARIRIPVAAIDEFARPSESPARAPRTGSEPVVEPQAHGEGKREEEA